MPEPKKKLFRRGSPGYYAGVVIGILLVIGVLAITITMFFNRPRLTDKDFEVPSEAAMALNEPAEAPVAPKKMPVARLQRERRRTPLLTVGGVPAGTKFNLTCYSYVMNRCDKLGIGLGICRPMARFAAKIPADKGMKYCRSSLEEKYPDYKKLIARPQVHANPPVEAKKVQATKKMQALPQNIQLVNEAGEVINRPKKQSDTGAGKKQQAQQGLASKGPKETKLSSEQQKKLLREAYTLMNEAHRASLTYSESPMQRRARLLKLKALIKQSKDKDLVKAYNSLVKEVTRNFDRPAGYGTKGRLKAVEAVGIDHPQGPSTPKDLRIIRQKMREAGVKLPGMKPQPIEQPVESAAAAHNVESSQGSLPGAAGSSPTTAHNAGASQGLLPGAAGSSPIQ